MLIKSFIRACLASAFLANSSSPVQLVSLFDGFLHWAEEELGLSSESVVQTQSLIQTQHEKTWHLGPSYITSIKLAQSSWQVYAQTSRENVSATDVESDRDEQSDDEDCKTEACESSQDSEDTPLLTESIVEDDTRMSSPKEQEADLALAIVMDGSVDNSQEKIPNVAIDTLEQEGDFTFSQVATDVFLNYENECNQSIFFNQDNPQSQSWIFMREKDSSIFYLATADKQGGCDAIFLAAPDCSNTDRKKVILGNEKANIEWTSTYSEQDHGWKFQTTVTCFENQQWLSMQKLSQDDPTLTLYLASEENASAFILPNASIIPKVIRNTNN